MFTFSIAIFCFFSIYPVCFINSFNHHDIENGSYFITGKISKINYISDSFCYLTLGDIKYLSNDNMPKSLDGNMTVGITNYAEEDFNLDIAYSVSFDASISAINFFDNKNKVNSLYIKDNLKYNATNVDISNIHYEKVDANIMQKLRSYNRNLLVGVMGEQNGNLAYSLIYGDKSYSYKDILNTFKYSGVIHVFSVSGLHVGLIAGLIAFILKKLRLSKTANLITTSAILFVFCVLCSFSASVVRASIMFVVFLLSKKLFKRYDMLSALALSGLIILLLTPMAFFDGGFRLTFVAVFGILFFSNLYHKIKIKNKTIAVIFTLVLTTISTQIMLMPILAEYYGYFATWSIMSNLVTLPIFSAFYPLLFVTNLTILILPFFAFLLVLPKVILELLIQFNYFVSMLPFGQIILYEWGRLSTILFYIGIFSISKYLMLPKNAKVAVSLSILSLSGVCFCIYNNDIFDNSKYLTFYAYNNSNATLIRTENDFYVVNPTVTRGSLSILKKELNKKKIHKLGGIIFSHYQNFEAKVIYDFAKDLNAKIFISSSHKSFNNLKTLGFEVFDLNNTISISKNFVIYPLTYLEDIIGVKIFFNDILFLFIYNIKNASNSFEYYLQNNIKQYFYYTRIYGNLDQVDIIKNSIESLHYIENIEEDFLLKLN